MTIRAANLAFFDLGLDLTPGSSVADHCRNVVDFVAEVVEVEQPRVSFAAIDAWVSQEISVDTCDQRLPKSRPVSGEPLGAWDATQVPSPSDVTLTNEADPLPRPS